MRILLLSLVVLMSGVAAAEPPCGETKYKPAIQGFFYGMSKPLFSALIQEVYPKARVIEQSEEIIKVQFPKGNLPFDLMAAKFTQSKLRLLSISYSNEFQEALGGSEKARGYLLERMKDRFGEFLESRKIEGGVRFTWARNLGGSLEVTAKEPYTLYITYECFEPVQ